MTKEQKFIPDFNIQDMLDKIVNKYIAEGHVVFEDVVYEKVNDELWFIYFTSQQPNYQSDYPMKMYYQVVAGFNCFDVHYYNTDMIDASMNHSLTDLKDRFRNFLTILLKDSEELVESL